MFSVQVEKGILYNKVCSVKLKVHAHALFFYPSRGNTFRLVSLDLLNNIIQ